MLKLHKDAGWIVSHAWSFRFLVLAAVLSGAEVVLPMFADHPPLPHRVYAAVIGVVVALALVARVVVQQHPPQLFDEPTPQDSAVYRTDPASTPVVNAPPAPAPAAAAAIASLTASAAIANATTAANAAIVTAQAAQ